jgi:hypothetical protein
VQLVASGMGGGSMILLQGGVQLQEITYVTRNRPYSQNAEQLKSNTTNAYSIHIQAECYSQKGNLITDTNNSSGVT